MSFKSPSAIRMTPSTRCTVSSRRAIQRLTVRDETSRASATALMA